MRKRLAFVVLVAGLIAGAAVPVFAAHNGNSQDHNVPICHRGRTIHVNPSAVPAHLRHGDTEGPCQVAAPTATPTATEPAPTDTPGPVATPTEPSEPEATETATEEPEATPTETVDPTPGGAGLRLQGAFAALRLW